MSDIFISYARSTEAQARRIGEALRNAGYGVWRDDELPAHRAYAEVIAERLRDAKAVVVLWSAEAMKSEWVRSEADRARGERKLVQLSLDGAALPMPFDQIQCADLSGWSGDTEAPGWKKVAASVAALVGQAAPAPAPAATNTPQRLAICVLPFANMSGDPEQEYFSDGISEDIITDLSKVGALAVTSRNSAFRYKGRHVDLRQVAAELGVSHVLEGSVRKAGNRVRITAQLIDGAADDHIWADRYDRELTDIFAVQDEISAAIVAALKLKLAPAEKRAIARRDTESLDAYNLYLMARQINVTGNTGYIKRDETIVSLCRRAVEIDPNFARAWALMADAQQFLASLHGHDNTAPLQSAERALALDPDLAEPHAIRARCFDADGRAAEARAEIETALRLGPDSYEVNRDAGQVAQDQGRIADAARHFEKAASLTDIDFICPGMLISLTGALGDAEASARWARLALERAEAALAQDGANGSALGFGVGALARLGEADRAREWIARAVAVDPDNMVGRYNMACSLCTHLGDVDGALDLLERVLATARPYTLSMMRTDPDMAPLRGNARFGAMVKAAEARLGVG
jgi:adenylate cyclase